MRLPIPPRRHDDISVVGRLKEKLKEIAENGKVVRPQSLVYSGFAGTSENHTPKILSPLRLPIPPRRQGGARGENRWGSALAVVDRAQNITSKIILAFVGKCKPRIRAVVSCVGMESFCFFAWSKKWCSCKNKMTLFPAFAVHMGKGRVKGAIFLGECGRDTIDDRPDFCAAPEGGENGGHVCRFRCAGESICDMIYLSATLHVINLHGRPYPYVDGF